jgi:vitamin B12 transporter
MTNPQSRAAPSRPMSFASTAIACVRGDTLLAPLVAVAYFCLPSFACGQEAPLEPVLVTATRSSLPLADALPSVTVLTREDIDATQSRDLMELLGRQVGLEFARSGGQGSQSSLFMRGTNSNQVLVLVDGARMNSVVDGAANLGGVSTASIERIEIVRGNLSSLYGSEAIGGVIQIFTRHGSQPGATAVVEAGQGHTRDASASVTAPLALGLITASAGFREQRAVASINPAQVPGINPDLDGNHSRNGSLRWDARSSAGELNAWGWGSHNDTDWSDPFNFSATIPTARIGQVEHSAQDAYGFSGTRILGGSRIRLSAAESRDDTIDRSNVANTDPYTDADNMQFRSRNRQITLQDTTTLSPGVDVNGGAEHLVQSGAITVFDYATASDQRVAVGRRVDSLWAGTTAHRGPLQGQLNVRRDHYSDVGGATTGLAGAGWSLDEHWKLTAQVATAFRAPSFNDLYYPGYSNPLLRPEHARSGELGLRWSGGGASASVVVFRNRTTDLINVGASNKPANVNRAALDGSEWQVADVLGPVRLGASLSLDRPRDLGTGLALLRRARSNARLYSTYTGGPWQASAEVQHTGARDDIDILTYARTTLPAFNLARASLLRSLGRDVRVHVRVENLFNTRYQLIDGYNTLPRLIIAGVDVTL